MPSKKLIVLAYYEYLKKQKLQSGRTNPKERYDCSATDPKERYTDILKNYVTYSDLNKLHKLKIINKEIYDSILEAMKTQD